MSLSYCQWKLQELKDQVAHLTHQIEDLKQFHSKNQIRAWKVRRKRLKQQIEEWKEYRKNLKP
jgi:gas vesicle protein